MVLFPESSSGGEFSVVTESGQVQVNGQHGSSRDDEWLEDVLEALRMAAKDAHLKAYQTGTGVVYRRNGKMGVYPPDPDMYKDLIPAQFEDSYEI